MGSSPARNFFRGTGFYPWDSKPLPVQARGAGREEGVVLIAEEGRAAGRAGAARRGGTPAPRVGEAAPHPGPAGSAATPLPREVPGAPGMLCPGVLVYSYESITVQDHPHPSNAARLSSHREL